MAEKPTKTISLKNLHGDFKKLNGQFSLLLVEMRRVNVKLEKIESDYRKMGVVLEEIETKLKLTLDGYAATNDRIEQLEIRMDEGFREVDFKLNFILDKLEQKADRMAR